MKQYSKILLSFLLLAVANFALASHFRAGEFKYKIISGYTYEFTLTIYSKASTLSPSPTAEIDWGDGTNSMIPQSAQNTIAGFDILVTTYVGRHTFEDYRLTPYIVSYTDFARNANVINIPNSERKPFHVYAEVFVNPFLKINNSVELLQPPIQNACVSTPFIHSPTPYDPDGDSLHFEIQSPRESTSDTILGYVRPTGSYTIDSKVGTIIWNSPSQLGEFNIAYRVNEFRNGYKIGSIFRDMQVTVGVCSERPPVIMGVQDTCTLSDDLITFDVRAHDPDSGSRPVDVDAIGGSFSFPSNQNPSRFSVTSSNLDRTIGRFEWFNQCSHIKGSKYIVNFIASKSNSNALKTFLITRIKVVGNKVVDMNAQVQNSLVQVTWDKHVCDSKAIRYDVYRKNDNSAWNPTYCQQGIPTSIGFTKIFSTNSVDDTLFFDTLGVSIFPGNTYCYRVVTIFENKDEGKASDEVCVDINSTDSRMEIVSVDSTNNQYGEISLRWTQPLEIDTQLFPPPYRYALTRINTNTGASEVLDTIVNIKDTTYTDTLLDTRNNQYSYFITLYNSSEDIIFFTSRASSVFLEADPMSEQVRLNFSESVPWSNVSYIIYRKNKTTNLFDSVGVTKNNTFLDTGLVNNVNYCYKIKAVGYYSLHKTSILENYSQEMCATPRDVTPPCPPNVQGYFDCSDFSNEITWSYSSLDCAQDAEEYRLFKRKTNLDSFELYKTYTNPSQFNINLPRSDTIYGCYKLKVIDTAGNVSNFTNEVCFSTCPEYRLPNVFTPNQDGVNDTYRAFPYKFIESVDMKIYNRWGKLVFRTTNPDINWDGTDVISLEQVGENTTFFYICIVNEITLFGIKPRTIKGTIELMSNKKVLSE